ncbi:hypothetical protein [Pasteurella sp. PK-2025]
MGEKTGYSIQQIRSWIDGKIIPQQSTLDYIIFCATVPEFKIISEFCEYNSDAKMADQLKEMLQEHKNSAGIYAFYNAMGELIYVGKASKLQQEISDALKRDVPISFPKGILKKPTKRSEVTKYISAYDVGYTLFSDYPKHVESLILRISKPKLNKNIGSLSKAVKKPIDD